MDKKNYFKRILTILIIIIWRWIIILWIIIYIYVRMNINRETDMPKSIEDYNNFELMSDILSGSDISVMYDEKNFIVYRKNDNTVVYKNKELPKSDKYYQFNNVLLSLKKDYYVDLVSLGKNIVLYDLMGDIDYQYIKILDWRKYSVWEKILWKWMIMEVLENNYYVLKDCNRNICPENNN